MLLLQKQGVVLAETGGFVAAAETVQLWDRAGAALGVLRGDGGDSRLRPLVAPRRRWAAPLPQI